MGSREKRTKRRSFETTDSRHLPQSKFLGVESYITDSIGKERIQSNCSRVLACTFDFLRGKRKNDFDIIYQIVGMLSKR